MRRIYSHCIAASTIGLFWVCSAESRKLTLNRTLLAHNHSFSDVHLHGSQQRWGEFAYLRVSERFHSPGWPPFHAAIDLKCRNELPNSDLLRIPSVNKPPILDSLWGSREICNCSSSISCFYWNPSAELYEFRSLGIDRGFLNAMPPHHHSWIDVSRIDIQNQCLNISLWPFPGSYSAIQVLVGFTWTVERGSRIQRKYPSALSCENSRRLWILTWVIHFLWSKYLRTVFIPVRILKNEHSWVNIDNCKSTLQFEWFSIVRNIRLLQFMQFKTNPSSQKAISVHQCETLAGGGGFLSGFENLEGCCGERAR